MKFNPVFLFPLALAALTLTAQKSIAQGTSTDSAYIGRYLKIHALSPHIYRYICSNYEVPSNGLIYINDGEALLVDAPDGDDITESLINWIEDKGLVLKAAVITHWHMQDRMGGIGILQRHHIKTYCSTLTSEIAKAKRLPYPEYFYDDSLKLDIGKGSVLCKYFGAGHTKDNSIVWFNDDKVLFGGCLIKDLSAKNFGYIKDADTKAWPQTIKKLINAFPHAKIVVPGHNDYGNKALLKHTLELSKAE